MVLRFIVGSSLVCSKTALAVTWIRGKTDAATIMFLYLRREIARLFLKTPIAHLSLVPQFTESTSSSRN